MDQTTLNHRITKELQQRIFQPVTTIENRKQTALAAKTAGRDSSKKIHACRLVLAAAEFKIQHLLGTGGVYPDDDDGCLAFRQHNSIDHHSAPVRLRQISTSKFAHKLVTNFSPQSRHTRTTRAMRFAYDISHFAAADTPFQRRQNRSFQLTRITGAFVKSKGPLLGSPRSKYDAEPEAESTPHDGR